MGSDNIHTMTVAQFRKAGLLQELNRQFLHPLGLALEVEIDIDGMERFGEIWDYQADPEGLRYEEFSQADVERGQQIEKLQKIKGKKRRELLGYIIQPLVECGQLDMARRVLTR